MNNQFFDLDAPLIEFSDQHGSSFFNVRHAVEGVLCTGNIGSGKTSAVGRMLATKYLSYGMGGIVLTAKPDERQAWESYCSKTNRLDDLVILEANGLHRFNFMEYESANRPGGISMTENMVQLLKTVLKSSEDKVGGKSDDQFWESSLDMYLHNIVALCQLAYGTVSVQLMYDMSQTIPRSNAKPEDNPKPCTYGHAFRAAQNNIAAQIGTDDELATISDPEDLEQQVIEKLPDARTLRAIDQFFIETFRNISEKTRSIIEMSFAGFLFRLSQDPIYSLMCRGASTFTPEDCLRGKIILINLPVKIFDKAGRDVQVLMKYIFQRAFERRNVLQDGGRPVFIYADEAQVFIHEHDMDFQATARSSRVAVVYLTQNLHNFFANIGGMKYEHRVKGFTATLCTKFFLANTDVETNRWASDLMGKGYTEDLSSSQTIAGQFSSSQSSRFELQDMVRPEEFVGLKTGGQDNNYLVECYVHRQGKPFHNGHNHLKVTFSQK